MTPDERAEALAARVLATLDRDRLAEVAARHGDGSTSGPSPSKYLDVERWVRVCARRAVALDLDLDRGRDVLDLGTGAGYFPLVCRELGHHVTATDHPQRPALYCALTDAIGVEVYSEAIEYGMPLTAAPTYDLITAFMVTFNGHGSRPWGVDEWAWFLDLALGTLHPGGRLVLELNREPDGRCYTPELEALFLTRGAVISAHWPHTPKRGGHRLVFMR